MIFVHDREVNDLLAGRSLDKLASIVSEDANVYELDVPKSIIIAGLHESEKVYIDVIHREDLKAFVQGLKCEYKVIGIASSNLIWKVWVEMICVKPEPVVDVSTKVKSNPTIEELVSLVKDLSLEVENIKNVAVKIRFSSFISKMNMYDEYSILVRCMDDSPMEIYVGSMANFCCGRIYNLYANYFVDSCKDNTVIISQVPYFE